jgi:hypothetical protein
LAVRLYWKRRKQNSAAPPARMQGSPKHLCKHKDFSHMDEPSSRTVVMVIELCSIPNMPNPIQLKDQQFC